ncbi:MAG: ABC transporter ATP-binding protein [Candidatus Magasanikbacteria bacterium]|nr:ABC transporter ATP-binding protein [Candidatus Magasanikbacteria bacterium]
MAQNSPLSTPSHSKKPSLISLLRQYSWSVFFLIVITFIANALNLAVPKLVSHTIDTYASGTHPSAPSMQLFIFVAIGIFVFTYIQSIAQTYISERVARDLRTKLIKKISTQKFSYIQQITPSILLTNLTSDVDAVKAFVSQAIASIVSSTCLIIGASILLISINWRLGLAVVAILPIIIATFQYVFSHVRKLFKKSQEAIDWLNKVINESILGAALIRLLNSDTQEDDKFFAANSEAKNIGLKILGLFSLLIPIITFAMNMATLIIVSLGGHYVITGSMSLGNFAAFNSYLAILIFPILIIGFISNVIAQASASYARLSTVLTAAPARETGSRTDELNGEISVHDVSVVYGERSALKNVSFTIQPGTKTAIIGPIAAGKSQLMYVLTGLLNPTSGTIAYDGRDISEYEATSFHNQIGLVFQDSIIFNASLRENIAFNTIVTDEALQLAIATAELGDFIEALPEKLNTIVSERGTSLSGGQKQRIMLARALALNPKILLLDDFTARVDTKTEKKILENIEKNYPSLTLLSITQKISAIEHYDQIILLVDGEILATGTHEELLESSTEYVQIFDSQRSTSTYELHAE